MSAPYPKSSKASLATSQSSFGLGDVYFTIFRHWGKIATGVVLGLIAAAWAYLFIKPTFVSEAKVYVIAESVVDRKAPALPDQASQANNLPRTSEHILNSELEILKSFDLALGIVDKIGADKIIGKTTGDAARDRDIAASILKAGISVENPYRSGIIRISFSGPHQEILQPVLDNLITGYLNKHVEIHRNNGILDETQKRERDALKLALSSTEAELRMIQTNHGIVSAQDNKRMLLEQKASRIAEELILAEAQLAEVQAVVSTLLEALGTNAPAANPGTAPVPPSKIEALKGLLSELDLLKRQEKELLRQYTEAHPAVKRIQSFIAESERQRGELEQAYPELMALTAAHQATVAVNPGATAVTGGQPAATDPVSRVKSLQAKIVTLKRALVEAHHDVNELVEAELRISQLSRTKALQESSYKYYQTSLDQAGVDDALAPGRYIGIKVVQAPSTPLRESESRLKLVMMAFLVPILATMGLAFALDMFIDQSVKRPSEMEGKANLPLFVSIPNRSELKGRSSRLLPNAQLKALPSGSSSSASAGGDLAVASVTQPELQPFFETLKDRMALFFEATGNTRTPKLVAVTSCHAQAGVSTVASGLAASLSCNGQGNVLVVDMNNDQGAAGGLNGITNKLGVLDVLDESKRADAQVQDNLYVVAERTTGEAGKRVPQNAFLSMLPKLKLSDYDYIIFDLPPVTHAGVAPRIARFMDMVLLVAQSDRTNAELLRKSARLLTESGAHVAGVLNRTKKHVPDSLSQEVL